MSSCGGQYGAPPNQIMTGHIAPHVWSSDERSVIEIPRRALPHDFSSWAAAGTRLPKLDIEPRIAKLMHVNVKLSNDIEAGDVSVGTILLSLAALTMAVAAYLLG